jgi:hypothetical protein
VRTLGKGLDDLMAYFFGTSAWGVQNYADEIRAMNAAKAQAASGATVLASETATTLQGLPAGVGSCSSCGKGMYASGDRRNDMCECFSRSGHANAAPPGTPPAGVVPNPVQPTRPTTQVLAPPPQQRQVMAPPLSIPSQVRNMVQQGTQGVPDQGEVMFSRFSGGRRSGSLGAPRRYDVAVDSAAE